jgi:hypothetical protein
MSFNVGAYDEIIKGAHTRHLLPPGVTQYTYHTSDPTAKIDFDCADVTLRGVSLSGSGVAPTTLSCTQLVLDNSLTLSVDGDGALIANGGAPIFPTVPWCEGNSLTWGREGASIALGVDNTLTISADQVSIVTQNDGEVTVNGVAIGTGGTGQLHCTSLVLNNAVELSVDSHGSLLANGGAPLFPTVPWAQGGALTWGQGAPSIASGTDNTLTITAGDIALVGTTVTVNGTPIGTSTPSAGTTNVVTQYLNQSLSSLALQIADSSGSLLWTLPFAIPSIVAPAGTTPQYTVFGSVAVFLEDEAFSFVELLINDGFVPIYRGGFLSKDLAIGQSLPPSAASSNAVRMYRCPFSFLWNVGPAGSSAMVFQLSVVTTPDNQVYMGLPQPPGTQVGVGLDQASFISVIMANDSSLSAHFE